MGEQHTATELISHYGTYAAIGDINMDAASAPPATTVPCFIASPTTVTITTLLGDPWEAGR